MGDRKAVGSLLVEQEVGRLIEQLSALGVRLSTEGDELSVSAPRGALTSELRGHLAAQKAQLIARLRQPAAEPASPWPVIVPATQERYLPFPLTDIQQAYWVGRTSGMTLGSVGCHGYWETDAVGIDIEQLEYAWQRLIDRHDMLRVTFLPTGEQQTLEEAPPFHIETVDLRGRSAAAAAAELGALRERMSHRLYAPDQWPLFDIRAARLDDRTTRLFLSIDLLVLDAASIFQLLGEAQRFYEDPTLELPPLKLTFRDYVIAEARLRETAEYKRIERYWLDRAATLPPAPDLPLVHDPAAATHRFIRRLEQLEAPVWRELRERASRAGLTPTGVLCTAWAEVLRVWSAVPEFTLTLTMFRRLPLHPQVNEIIGDFTSTILLECSPCSGGFRTRAKALQAQLADDLDHSMVGGVHVMRERARMLGTVQNAGFPVVFTSTLGHQAAADQESSPLAWLGNHVYSVSQTPQVTLDLQVSNYADGALLVLDAVDALFPTGLLDDMFDAYRRLVRRLTEDDAAWQESPRSNMPLSAVALETRARVNATAAPVSSQLLHELFFEQAAKHPANTAVISPSHRVSYGELLAAANRIGRWLRNEEVHPNSIVAVVMEKGWEQVAAVLGVLASGAAYLPIEPTVPAERLQYLLEHAQVRWVLTQPALDSRLIWPAGVRRLSVDERVLDPADAPSLDVVQRPSDLAYLIYTSGSTGLPKGVMIDHRGAVNTVLDINRRFQVGSDDRVLALSSLCFDLSVYDIFGLLAAGGAIVFPEDARRHDPAHWSELVDAERITIWNTVPTLMEVWVETREKEAPTPLPLRLVLMSGDWIPVTLPERIRALAAGARDRASRPPRIISLGGATEASIWSILYPIECVNPRWKSIPYGRAMVNQTFHVLDEELEPCPVWVPGMLHIGGIGLAQGYWRDEEKTNAAFIVHPRTGERFYRTGDLGRFLPDGNIEFLGRKDGQVKVGGHRIELGEVEANLLRHPSVQQAAVVVRQEPNGGKRLVGFVVPTPGAAIPDLEEELRRHLFSKLPDYMVPSIFCTLASMPVTANAKIDRKKLVDLAAERARPMASAAGAAPETTTERTLGAVVAKVLGQQMMGRFDSFFEVGCTSIELLRLASRIREVFGQTITLAELFRNPTVAALAARLDGREPPPPPDVEVVEQPRPAAQHGAASPGQEQLWFAERLRPGRSTYHVHAALRMLGRIDVDALQAAVSDVIDRHQALRMFFHEVDGRPFWTVRPAEEVAALTVMRVDALEGEAREEEARRRASVHARIPFDLNGGPLSRLDLVAFAPDDVLLLLTQHHLVTDGWSIGVLARDLIRAYLARANGCAPDWTGIPIEYGDLILREREWLESDAAEQMRAWWRERLAGLRPLELPFRRRTAAMPRDAGDLRTFCINATLTSELQAFAAREGTTAFAVLFAAFAALLYRYSRLDDFGIGVVTANRPVEDQSDTMGFLANTVVLRCDLSGDPSFSTWLACATDAVTETLERQRIPFFELTRLLESRAYQSLNPLVQACFAFENVPVPEIELPGLVCRSMMETPDAGVKGTAKFDLALVIAPAKEGLTADFQFATEIFDAPIIERMIMHFMSLLEAAVRNSGTTVSRLPLLMPAERRHVLVDWNVNPAAEVSDCGVAELVEAQAAQRPNAPALVCGDEVWSYATLNRRANRLARHLRMLGVGPEARVALCAHRRLETVAGMLAVLKAGAAYVPIDPTYPAERQAFILEDSAPLVVMGHQALLSALPVGARAVVDLEQPYLDEDGADLRTTSMPESLAYVIYTSGSTGRPKGVENTRRGLMNLVRWYQRAFGVTPDDRATQTAALGFDATVFELWPILTAGASLHMPSDAVRQDIEALHDWLIVQHITVSFLVTALAEEMLGLPWPQNTTLRLLLTAADALRRYPPENLPFVLVNNYGPSECAVCTTSGVVRHEANPVRLPTIGRPIDGVCTYVLDGHMEPVPPGCDGELYIGGASVARGYRNAPALTAERFVPDPFGDEAGGRLYRTGDMARWTDSGELEFLGRTDDQVKVRGFRIELGEIEAVLSAHTAVMANVVVAREDIPGEKRLVAYVVARDGHTMSRGELRTYLKTHLPDYMVPSAFVFLQVLPLTPNGKVNRAALPAPETQETPQPGALPRTPIEEILAAIWAEVLRRDQVGVDQDFFDLGGHSLLAMQVVSRIRRTLDLEVPVRTLFEAPKVSLLAARLQALQPTGAAALPPITARATAEAPPLSFAQERLWFLDQLQPGSAFYNIPAALQLDGPLNVAVLKQTLNEVVRRHEALRTRFETVAGEPRQMIEAEVRVPLTVVDLAGLTEPMRHAEVKRQVSAEGRRPFDLATGPLLRTQVLRLGAEQHVLLLTLHHIVADGWSVGILAREVATIYEALAAGQPSPLPSLAVQYRDFSAWQRDWLGRGTLEGQMAYWEERLGGGVPALELPTESRPATRGDRGAVVRLTVSRETTEALKTLGRTEGATLFMVLLAAFKTLLWRYTGQTDLVVGTPVAGRMRPEIEGLIGCFVNTLALRTDVSGDPTFRALVGRVKEVTLGGYAHQEVPFEWLVERLQPERDPSRTPLFQAVVVLQNTSREELQLRGVRLTPLEVDSGTSKFDVTWQVREEAGGLTGALEYSTDLFNAAWMGRMARHLETLLGGASARPDRRLSELPVLTAVELAQLIEWNATGTPYKAERCLHELFEEQVERTPLAVAVVYEQEQLSYQELNRRSNQLAHYLRELGVGPETPVGICLERSLDMVIALLAVLKSGGAYVPLDPGYPQERLQFMVEDAQVTVVISQRTLQKRFLQNQAELVFLDDLRDEIQQRSDDRVESGVTVGNPAYVIYTSGSTGRPKGAMVTHANVARLMIATQGWFGFTRHDVWTMFHSYAFDFSVWEIWGALLYGGRLEVVPYWVSRSPEAFYALVRDRGVTVLNQTPSAFQQFSHEDQARSGKGEALKLRLVIFGGEALEMSSLRPWFERHGDEGPQMVNMYGITETTVHVTYKVLSKETVQGNASVIGVRIPDLQLYILREMHPVPTGVIGEMYVGGAGLARGYWKRPELTAERFLPHPFSVGKGERLYRTGDLGRYREDGSIEYLGRMDQQIKIRGHRIELGEIEAALEGYEAVKQAAVIMREDQPGEKRLVAYLVKQTAGDELDVSQIRNYLQARLPEYMVPGALMVLESLPLTAHGKLDRAALPRPEWKGDEKKYVAPRNPVEEKLTRIWGHVLGVQRVGILDNFFALGGDSIISIQVLARCREAGLKIALRQLFEHQTIASLAQVVSSVEVEENEGCRGGPFSLIIEEDRRMLPEDVEDAYPLSRLQAGMLFHDEYSSGTPLYHNISSFHLRAPFEAEVFRRVVDELVERHEVLRTSFHITGYSQPLQCVHRKTKVEVEVEVGDLRHLSAGEQAEALEVWKEEEKRRRFDVDHPGLLRFHLHRRTEESFQFSLTEHHVILDGWSVASLLTELFGCYFGLLRGEWRKRERLASHFRDFISAEMEIVRSEEARQFWQRQLSGMEVANLPWEKQHSAETAIMKALSVPITPETSKGLIEWARQLGVSLKSTLLAAHVRVLSLITGQQDVMTGTTSNGRMESRDAEQVLGLFLNSPPFRIQLTGGSWKDLVKETAELEVALLSYHRYPLADIQILAAGAALFDVNFNFVHFHIYRELEQVQGVEVLDGDTFAFTNFALDAAFSLDPVQSNLQLLLSYNSSTVKKEQIEAIGRYYQNALKAMVRDPDGRYEITSLLSEEERDQVLYMWNRTATDYPQDRCVHQLFVEQVGLHPEKTAVACGDEVLTYQQVYERSQELALYLQALGLKPDSLVGIFMEPSLDMVIGLLGILQAGGAYVPLDQDYPEERLAYMLQDSQALIVLTQAKLEEKLTPLITAGARVIVLDRQWPEIMDRAVALEAGKVELQQQVKPHHLAYVIYTSGSTGKPKGVMVEHRSFCNYLNYCKANYTSSGDNIYASFSHLSLAFDASVTSLFVPLLAGKAININSSYNVDTLREGEFLNRGYDFVKLTPSHLFLLKNNSHNIPEEYFQHKNLFIIGGEALTHSHIDFLRLQNANVDIVNEYGPTEATVGCTTYRVSIRNLTQASLRSSENISIGAPIANTQIYILDPYNNPQPIGVPGELHVAGDCLARGYLNRPELTEEKFVPNPFQPGTRMYKTGDLARWLADGNIEFMGRIDTQVKIRGFRIELGEIETRLNQHPAIEDCVVIAQGQKAEKRLIAFYRAKHTRADHIVDVESEELRAHLLRTLPEYMVPAAFVSLAVIPLNPNGKVDRRGLAQMEVTIKSDQEYLGPRNETEKQLIEIWAQTLKLEPEKIGINDSFFELGGHSLLAPQLFSTIEQRLGRRLPLGVLYSSPTIEAMAKAFSPDAFLSSVLVPFAPVGDGPKFFCVHPGGGAVMLYKALADHLLPALRLYGLQAPGVMDAEQPLRSIESMARRYVDELRAEQPHGPYHVGGYSLGGIVAFHMATILMREGEEVATLAVIDCAPQGSVSALDPRVALTFFARAIGISMREEDVPELRYDETIKYVARRVACKTVAFGTEEEVVALLRRVLRLADVMMQAWQRYQPRPYPGALVLLKAAEGMGETYRFNPDSAYGWASLAEGPLMVADVPGTHETMVLEPNVRELARTLSHYILSAGVTHALSEAEPREFELKGQST